MAVDNEKLKAMLDYIVEVHGAEALCNALFPIYEAAVRAKARYLMENYVAKKMQLIGDSKESNAPCVPEHEPDLEKPAHKKSSGGCSSKWEDWKEHIVNVDIDETKYTYTKVRDHSWVNAMFELTHKVRTNITWCLMCISEDLNLGVKQEVNKSYHIPYAYANPVYTEFISRYRADKLPKSVMATLKDAYANKHTPPKKDDKKKPEDFPKARIISRPDAA